MEDVSAGVFTCQMCGRCCCGRGGIVVGPEDLERLASFLKISGEEVKSRYCEQAAGKLKIRVDEHLFCCFFSSADGCTVHEAKPAVCRAWPFFRGNIEDPTSLDMAKEFCPGINPAVEHSVFAAAGRTYLKLNGLLAHDPLREANALILD